MRSIRRRLLVAARLFSGGLRGVRDLGHDPWLTPDGPEGLRRQAARLARRGAGWGKLTLQSVLGAVVIFPLLLIFGVLFALGIDAAGWLLGLTLLPPPRPRIAPSTPASRPTAITARVIVGSREGG